MEKILKDGDREEEILLESSGHEIKEVVHSGGGGGKLKVMYTNIDGLLSGMLELRDYLIEKKSGVSVTETKLREEVQISFKDQGYNVWRRDRKGKAGGGILIIVRDNIYIEEIEYGDNAAEIASITIRTNGRERRKIIVTYVPPKTNTWGLAEHQEMQREVLTSLGKMLRKDKKILLLGDFNCKNINWDAMEICENGGPRGGRTITDGNGEHHGSVDEREYQI